MDIMGSKLSISKSGSNRGDLFYVSDLSKEDIIEAWHKSKAEIFSLNSKCNDECSSSDETLLSPAHSLNESESLSDTPCAVNTMLRSQGKTCVKHILKTPCLYCHLILIQLTLYLTQYFGISFVR